jgi:hypothetical protein
LRPGRDRDQVVLGERLGRAGDQPGIADDLHLREVRRGEDVGRSALCDLRRQRVGAGEIEADRDAGFLGEGRAGRVERLGQRRRRKHGEARGLGGRGRRSARQQRRNQE